MAELTVDYELLAASLQEGDSVEMPNILQAVADELASEITIQAAILDE